MVRTLTAAQELAEFSRQPRSPKEALISVNLGAFAMGHDINRPETELSPPIVPAGLHEFIIGNQAPSPDITDFIATLPPDARRMIEQCAGVYQEAAAVSPSLWIDEDLLAMPSAYKRCAVIKQENEYRDTGLRLKLIQTLPKEQRLPLLEYIANDTEISDFCRIDAITYMGNSPLSESTLHSIRQLSETLPFRFSQYVSEGYMEHAIQQMTDQQQRKIYQNLACACQDSIIHRKHFGGIEVACIKMFPDDIQQPLKEAITTLLMSLPEKVTISSSEELSCVTDLAALMQRALKRAETISRHQWTLTNILEGFSLLSPDDAMKIIQNYPDEKTFFGIISPHISPKATSNLIQNLPDSDTKDRLFTLFQDKIVYELQCLLGHGKDGISSAIISLAPAIHGSGITIPDHIIERLYRMLEIDIMRSSHVYCSATIQEAMQLLPEDMQQQLGDSLALRHYELYGIQGADEQIYDSKALSHIPPPFLEALRTANVPPKNTTLTTQSKLHTSAPEHGIIPQRKTGSDTYIGSDETAVRIIPFHAFNAWLAAYLHPDAWREFGYVPIEPICSVALTDHISSGYFELSSYKSAAVQTLSLRGEDASTSINSYTPAIAIKILEAIHDIRNTLQHEVGVIHGHPHLGNFMLVPQLTNGQPDPAKMPRVYMIDFDQATRRLPE
ncbi:MAG TPA: hypothetical protein PKD19_03995 [Candidatus Saccharibacteria bacterium]|nr:hypothetical protein [Candidatus Saccharibacteria bacterium]HMR38327.1 hypothetical protein [Candidatus Saccharibacteria bacterium]